MYMCKAATGPLAITKAYIHPAGGRRRNDGMEDDEDEQDVLGTALGVGVDTFSFRKAGEGEERRGEAKSKWSCSTVDPKLP